MKTPLTDTERIWGPKGIDRFYKRWIRLNKMGIGLLLFLSGINAGMALFANAPGPFTAFELFTKALSIASAAYSIGVVLYLWHKIPDIRQRWRRSRELEAEYQAARQLQQVKDSSKTEVPK